MSKRWKKHSLATQSIEERLTRLELGEARKDPDMMDTRSTAGSTLAPNEGTPMRISLGGSDSKTSREAIVYEATEWLAQQSAELRGMVLELNSPTKSGVVAKLRCQRGESRAP